MSPEPNTTLSDQELKRPAKAEGRFGAWKDVLAAAQSVATVIALLIGGFWTYWVFVENREDLPHANISESVTGRLISPEWYWLQVSVTITNAGKHLVAIGDADITVQQILPLPDNISKNIVTKQDSVPRDAFVIPWHGLCRYARPSKISVEPGEHDTTTFDFVIPAWVRLVKIYSFFKHPKIGWHETVVYEIKGSTEGETQAMSKLTPSTDRICAFDGPIERTFQ
jgi:hypothetical protein